MSNYSSLSRVLSPFRVSNPKRYMADITLYCYFLGTPINNAIPVDIGETTRVEGVDVPIEKFSFGHLKKQIWPNNNEANKLRLWKFETPFKKANEKLKILNENFHKETDLEQELGEDLSPGELIRTIFPVGYVFSPNHIHIIVQPPSSPATTGTLSIPMKRQAEPQVYNREPVTPREREFWKELAKAQIVLKLPDDADKTIYMTEPLSKYMKVEGNKVVLVDSVMLNSEDELIFCDGNPVIESGERITINFMKFLRFCKSPDGIVYGIEARDILIKKSYLQMIKKIELDRINQGTKGCVIVGSPGIGKTHFSLYLAFYITRRYNSDDIMYEQQFQNKSRLLYIKSNDAVMRVVDPEQEDPQDCFYIVDSVKPAPWKTKYTFLVTTPKCDLWHDFIKVKPRRYYAPIWSEEEIWNVWNLNDQYKDKISETRVKELIKKWGCIPRRVFVEHNDEPNLAYLVSKCDVYKVIKDDGGDLDNEYSGKVIHIIPNDDFTDKTYVPASAEVSEALYRNYETRAKDAIINLIRDLAGGAGGTFAGNFFEMLAHDVLRKGGKFRTRRLTDDNQIWPVQELDLRGLELNRYDGIQEINSGYYNFPKIKNFEFIDAIAPHCDGIHYLYQITTAGKHDTKVNGLIKLENHLGGNIPIHLYFVVPDINHIFNNFHYQNYVTTKGGKYEGWNGTNEWIRDEIEQYVLEIKLNAK